MNKKILAVGGLVTLVGCNQEQAVPVVKQVLDAAAPVAAAANPLAGYAVQGLAALAAAFIAYKTGIHKPVLNTCSAGVGLVGDMAAVVGKAITGHTADLCQAAEDKLSQD